MHHRNNNNLPHLPWGLVYLDVLEPICGMKYVASSASLGNQMFLRFLLGHHIWQCNNLGSTLRGGNIKQRFQTSLGGF
jgi:hypothetical protein